VHEALPDLSLSTRRDGRVAHGHPGRRRHHVRGVNWADSRDHYVDGWGIPTGRTSDNNVRTKADGIITGFRQQLGANTVRLPMNEPFGYSLNSWVSLCSS
jgi:hypothetical protein